jgi:hypothetical protein
MDYSTDGCRSFLLVQFGVRSETSSRTNENKANVHSDSVLQEMRCSGGAGAVDDLSRRRYCGTGMSQPMKAQLRPAVSHTTYLEGFSGKSAGQRFLPRVGNHVWQARVGRHHLDSWRGSVSARPPPGWQEVPAGDFSGDEIRATRTSREGSDNLGTIPGDTAFASPLVHASPRPPPSDTRTHTHTHTHAHRQPSRRRWARQPSLRPFVRPRPFPPPSSSSP